MHEQFKKSDSNSVLSLDMRQIKKEVGGKMCFIRRTLTLPLICLLAAYPLNSARL